MKLFVLLALSVLPRVKPHQCETAKFCDGIILPTIGGTCTESVDICDDMDDSTLDGCDADNQLCSHTLIDATSAQCFTDCEKECEGRECGEDGCGEFCGVCGAGTGCLDGLCVAGVVAGTCNGPYNLGNGETAPVIELSGTERITFETTGDTGFGVHQLTPTCNFMTASPELIYTFTIPEGKTYGYDMQLSGYDTVIELMKDVCGVEAQGRDRNLQGMFIETITASVACNDDGTPPGDYGSHIFGTLTGGTYFVMIDGFSSLDFGTFFLKSTFINDCEPSCDGNFCGGDTCGGVCGTCEGGFECLAANNRCYPESCQPNCEAFGRSCGEDGCGGSCGTCEVEGEYCLGVSIMTEDVIPSSACVSFKTCNNANPVCEECTDDQICGSDCECYDGVNSMPDLVVLEHRMLEESFLHDVIFPETSCSYAEGCVAVPGLRRLLRFTSAVLNQGNVDFNPADPKIRPDLYEYGACHQHYHFKGFAQYTLFAEDGVTVVLAGRKYAYCMEDTVRATDGIGVNCQKTYDCGAQGIQRGWTDEYGWSLDCSWIDITGLPSGWYELEVAVNPLRVFAEANHDNNIGRIKVYVPEAETGSVSVALKLETEPAPTPSTSPAPTPSTSPAPTPSTSGGKISKSSKGVAVLLVLLANVVFSL